MYAKIKDLIRPAAPCAETDVLLSNGLNIRIRSLSGLYKLQQEDLPRFEYVIGTLYHGILTPHMTQKNILKLIENSPALALEIFDLIQRFTAESMGPHIDQKQQDLDFLNTLRSIERSSHYA